MRLTSGGWNPPLSKQDLHFYTDFRMVPEKNPRGGMLRYNIETESYLERPTRESYYLMMLPGTKMAERI